MSAAELQASFARLCVDRPFRNWFKMAPDEALDGYRLTDDERQVLENINTKSLEMFARSLLIKRREYVTAMFPHISAVVPDEVTRFFNRFYELHPARPGEGVSTQALAFGRFLADSLATATGVPAYAADLVRFETVRLEVRRSTLQTGQQERINGQPETHERTPVHEESVPRLAEGVCTLRLDYDIPELIKKLGGGTPPATMPLQGRIVLLRPAAHQPEPEIFTINEATLGLLDRCDGVRSLGEIRQAVFGNGGYDGPDRAIERVVAAMVRAGVLVVSE